LAVAELQRIQIDLRQLGPLVLALVEQQLQAAHDPDPQMMAAMGADPLVRLELAVEDHLAAGRALVPEIVGRVRLADQGTDLRPDEVGEPAHAAPLRLRAGASLRAARTPA